MTSPIAAAADRSFGPVAAVAVFLGVLVVGYGLLLLPLSGLGGLHVVAIGASLGLAGLFSTAWAGARWDLSAAERRRLSLSFAVLALLLLVAFVVLNYASVESGFVEGGNSGGG